MQTSVIPIHNYFLFQWQLTIVDGEISKDGEILFIVACREGRADIVSFLLSKGVDPDTLSLVGKFILCLSLLH